MKKLFNITLLTLLLLICLVSPTNLVFAEEDDDEKNYIVYTEDNYYLFERPDVMVGIHIFQKILKNTK